MAALRAYRWPGNVRELRNVIERALAIGDGDQLALCDLPLDVIGQASDPAAPGGTLPQAVAALERELIVKALRRARGKKVQAAQALGISRPTLDKKIDLHRIDLFGDPP
jgi:DNA-binding NtrC family response regulator